MYNNIAYWLHILLEKKKQWQSSGINDGPLQNVVPEDQACHFLNHSIAEVAS